MTTVPRDYSYKDARSGEDIKRSPLTFIILMFALVGIVWLSWKGVPAGNIYLTLFIFGVMTLFLALFFTKSNEARYETPIATDIYASVVFMVLGITIPLILFGLPLLFNAEPVNTAQTFVPLTFGLEQEGAQTFSAVSTIENPFWKVFVIVITAGAVEPLSIGFAAVAFGVILGFMIRKLGGVLPKGIDFGDRGNKIFDFMIGMIFSIAFFMIIHTLNESYVTVGMFIIAGIFRLVMNTSLYVFNFALAFLIGFHQSNNMIAIGIGNTISGLLTHPIGWLILMFYGLVFLSFFINIKRLPEVIKSIPRNIGL